MVKFYDNRIIVKTGDITREPAEAIVNAANSSLMGGGGVDGAIHRAGGQSILEECRKIRQTEYPGGLPDGEVVITTAGEMAAKYVIHTVGPRWAQGHSGEPGKLANCYRNALELAKKHKIKSVAFPAISTGVYGYPLAEASQVASKTVIEFIENEEIPETVTFIFFSATDMDVFLENSEFKK